MNELQQARCPECDATLGTMSQTHADGCKWYLEQALSMANRSHESVGLENSGAPLLPPPCKYCGLGMLVEDKAVPETCSTCEKLIKALRGYGITTETLQRILAAVRPAENWKPLATEQS